MPGVMDFFRGITAPTTTSPNPAVTAVSPAAPANAATAAANQTIPSATTIPQSDGKIPAIPASPIGDESPMAKFADLFKIDDKAVVLGSPVPSLTPDPVKLAAAVKDVDFTKGIDAALMEKALKGDGASLVAVINQSGQSALAQSSAITARIVEQALTTLTKNYETQVIPAVLRQNNVNVALAENPLFANPATAPILEGLKTQFITKYPSATADEISTLANEYLQNFAGMIVGTDATKQITDVPKPAAGAKKETDWSALIG